MSQSEDTLVGATLDGLQMIEKIGKGGMGEVWRAKDIELDIDVAVKVLPPELAEDQFFLVNFIREARAIAKLDHPNIVRVLQAGAREHAGQTLRILVMELIEGRDTHALLHDSPDQRLDQELVAQIGLAVASALMLAHQKGITHRDIKPANIIVSDDNSQIKVLDFGVAKMRSLVGGVTIMGGANEEEVIVGTPLYMPPEQARGGRVGPAADIYSLGITLFELLTGFPPFDGHSRHTIYSGHQRKALPVEELKIAGIPDFFAKLLKAMCAKDPAERLPLETVTSELKGYIGHASRPDSSAELEAHAHFGVAPRDSSFVARDEYLRTISDLFDQGAKLVSLLGPGGVGKTRLSEEFALRQRDHFSGGVYFADLSEARNAKDAAEAIAREIGIDIQADTIGQIKRVLSLKSAPTLLILDNLEQVVESFAPIVRDWLPACARVSFLGSSREAMQIEGEHAINLQPLGPGGVQLFIDRAKSINPRLSLGEETEAVIAKIVDQLDGIPLAIELAAARSGVLTPQQILERLPRRFELLRSRRRDHSQRQQTLFGAIEWSWDLLKDHEKSALVQCSVFQGGFFLDAAEAVIDIADCEDAPFEIDAIEALVSKSLLTASDVDHLPGERRYRMLESVRQFAESRLVNGAAKQEPWAPDIDELLTRHAEHYIKYGEGWHELAQGPDCQEAMQRLELELKNILAVQDGIGHERPQFGAKALLIAEPLLLAFGPTQELYRRAQSLRPKTEELSPEVNTRLQRMYAIGKGVSAHFDEALAEIEKGKYFCEQIEDYKTQLRARISILMAEGWVLNRMADFKAAATVRKQIISLTREYGDKGLIAHALADYGVSVGDQRQYPASIALFKESLEVNRESRNLLAQAKALSNLANMLTQESEFDEALRLNIQVEEVNRMLGRRVALARTYGNRALIYMKQGKYSEALESLHKAYPIAQDGGDLRSIAAISADIAICQLELGSFVEAMEMIDYSLKLTIEQGHKQREANRRAVRAHIYVAMERPLEALPDLSAITQFLESDKADDEDRFESFAIFARVHLRIWQESGERKHLVEAQSFAEKSLAIMETEFGQTPTAQRLINAVSILSPGKPLRQVLDEILALPLPS